MLCGMRGETPYSVRRLGHPSGSGCRADRRLRLAFCGWRGRGGDHMLDQNLSPCMLCPLKATGTRWQKKRVENVQTKFLRCLVLGMNKRKSFLFFFSLYNITSVMTL